MSRHYGSKENARQARVLTGPATAKAVVSIVRRLGIILLAVYEVAERELMREGYNQTAEEMRDTLKPLFDSLIHFEVTTREDDDATA